MIRDMFVNPIVSHPGKSLKEKIEEDGMSIKEFAVRTDKPEKTIHAVIKGESSITSDMAIAFESVTGIKASFWIRRQGQYEEFMARERREEENRKAIDWARKFDYCAMSKMGWVPICKNVQDRVSNLFSYFKMGSTNAWENYYLAGQLKVSFRTSLKNVKDPYNTSAWLRRGVIQAEQIDTPEYNQEILKSLILEMKQLMVDCPQDYLSQLQLLCKKAGVKLVYTPRLKKVPVNGAMRWVGENPIVQLSDKQKSYDVFWFSFFHEIGHVLLNKKKSIYIEYDDKKSYSEDVITEEKNADDFASKTLLSKEAEDEIVGNKAFNKADIYKYASKYHTHPSIIVGRLHHIGVLPYSALNDIIPHVEICG